jgi:hypothetical protein
MQAMMWATMLVQATNNDSVRDNNRRKNDDSFQIHIMVCFANELHVTYFDSNFH